MQPCQRHWVESAEPIPASAALAGQHLRQVRVDNAIIEITSQGLSGKGRGLLLIPPWS